MVVGTLTDAGAARRCPLTSLWAVVDADGDPVRGKGVTSSRNGGTGDYAVFFNRKVSGCAYAATTGARLLPG